MHVIIVILKKQTGIKKEEEIKHETERYKGANYKVRITIIKVFVLSKLSFIATVFPPDDKCIMRLNNICTKFIEVTKGELLF